jgi:hypothetical protein
MSKARSKTETKRRQKLSVERRDLQTGRVVPPPSIELSWRRSDFVPRQNVPVLLEAKTEKFC